MSKKETLKRYLLFVISLFFIALGIAFAKHAKLGMSPITSVSNVMSCKFTSISIGTWLVVWNCLMILGQILILRKNFKPVQFLQLPLSFVFGYFTDLCLIFVTKIPAESYPVQMCLVIASVFVIALGVELAVIADVMLNSSEAFVKVVSDTTGKKFGDMKSVYDVSCVLLTTLLSLLFFGNRVEGVREGTVITAVFVGMVVKLLNKYIRKPIEKILTK